MRGQGSVGRMLGIRHTTLFAKNSSAVVDFLYGGTRLPTSIWARRPSTHETHRTKPHTMPTQRRYFTSTGPQQKPSGGKKGRRSAVPASGTPAGNDSAAAADVTAEVAIVDDDVEQINRLCGEIVDHGKSALMKALEAGERLCRVKKQVGHGNWGQWCKENLSADERTAQRYMEIYRHQALFKSDTVSDLAGALRVSRQARRAERIQKATHQGPLADREADAERIEQDAADSALELPWRTVVGRGYVQMALLGGLLEALNGEDADWCATQMDRIQKRVDDALGALGWSEVLANKFGAACIADVLNNDSLRDSAMSKFLDAVVSVVRGVQ